MYILILQENILHLMENKLLVVDIHRNREFLIIFPRNSIFYYTDDPPTNVIIYMCKINVEKSVRWPRWRSEKHDENIYFPPKILGEIEENLWNTVAN